MLQNDQPTVDHWYMVIVPQQVQISTEDVVLKLKGALSFVEGIGAVDVDIMGSLEPDDEAENQNIRGKVLA